MINEEPNIRIAHNTPGIASLHLDQIIVHQPITIFQVDLFVCVQFGEVGSIGQFFLNVMKIESKHLPAMWLCSKPSNSSYNTSHILKKKGHHIERDCKGRLIRNIGAYGPHFCEERGNFPLGYQAIRKVHGYTIDKEDCNSLGIFQKAGSQ